MRELVVLIIAALFEVGGDALIRWGLKGGGTIGFILGAAVLFAYGYIVNTTKWDFGRMLGIYIVIFFIISQVLSIVAFHETPHFARLVAGILIASGGVVLLIY